MHGPWAITAFDTASCVAAQAPSLRPCQMLAAAEVSSATLEQFGAQPWSMHAAAAAAVELEEVEPNQPRTHHAHQFSSTRAGPPSQHT